MTRITPFLTFNDQAKQAAEHYVAIFDDARVVDVARAPDGRAFMVTFELEGRRYLAMNGGPSFAFSTGISLFVSCRDQEEVDYYWAKLLEGGGAEGRCGWLTDRFGVSWQVVPASLSELLSRPGVHEAMMTMTKLDIEALRRAGEASS